MKKILTSVFLVFALLAVTATTVFAQEATPITGIVQTVVLETDTATGETVVVVTILDETTTLSQSVRINLETAATLGLITIDPVTTLATVTETSIGTTVVIDPTTILLDETEAQHPVGSALADFFSNLLGVNYDAIMSYHDDGVGFGVIAQALWVNKNMDGNNATFSALIDAKKSGDYSAIVLEDGSTPSNWGDVVKSLKKGENLGSVMSDKDHGASAEPSEKDHGNNNKNNGHGNGNGNGHP